MTCGRLVGRGGPRPPLSTRPGLASIKVKVYDFPAGSLA